MAGGAPQLPSPEPTRREPASAARNNPGVGLFYDPASTPDPEREDTLRAAAARVELRPAERAAWLRVGSLACPGCDMPITLAGPVGFSDVIACAFCETEAPTRDFVRDQGWPAVDLIARII
jgi:hypothetical protein